MKKELKNYNKITSYGIISVIIFSLIITSIFLLPAEATPYNTGKNKINNAGLVEHESIYIANDAAFDTYGFPGDGSVNNPYRIEYLNITTTDDDAIIVVITTKHFIIQNCYLQAVRYGIYLHVVGDYTATLFNNTVKNTDGRAINLLDSDGVIVANNTLINNKCDRNMWMQNCENVIVANNTIMGSPHAAVVAQSCENCTFYYNHFENNVGYGLVIYSYSDDCLVFHNNFKGNKPGNPQAYLEGASYALFYNPDILEGNWWSDWQGSGSYAVAGDDPIEDPYPLAEEIPSLKNLGYKASAPRSEVTPTPTETETTPTPTPTETETTPPEESIWSLISIFTLMGLLLLVRFIKRK